MTADDTASRNGQASRDSLPLLTPSSAVRSVETRYLWDGHLVADELNLLVGREKLGKSTGALWIAARLTTGTLPGDFLGTPLTVGYLSAEDSATRTLKPRAVAARADHDRLLFLADSFADMRPSDLVDLGLDVVVFDPISAFIDIGHHDESGEIRLRQAFLPFREIADVGISVLGIRHERKGGAGDSPFDAVLGSRAWSAAFRSIVFFTPDKENEDRAGGLIFQRGNLTRPSPGMRYRLESTKVPLDDGHVGDVPLFVIEDSAVSISLEEAMAPRERATARLDAEAFLVDLLADGPVPADEVFRLAEQADISKRTLARAKKDQNVRSQKVGNVWQWVLNRATAPP